MRRRGAAGAEVFRRGHDAGAEVPLPDAIHLHARHQGGLARAVLRQPAGPGQAATGGRFFAGHFCQCCGYVERRIAGGQSRQRGRFDLFARGSEVAALQQIDLGRLGRAVGDDGQLARLFAAGIFLLLERVGQLLAACLVARGRGLGRLVVRGAGIAALDDDVVDDEAAAAAILEAEPAVGQIGRGELDRFFVGHEVESCSTRNFPLPVFVTRTPKLWPGS